MANREDQRLLPGATLIAHRGYRQAFPENTLVALEQAFAVGACCIEFDVQLSRDQVPVVIHDHSLARTGNHEGDVFELGAAELTRCSVGEPGRFASRFSEVRIPLLAEVCELLQRWPDRLAMVEIKRASLKRFGVAECLSRIVQALQPVLARCVFISFNAEVLVLAKAQGLAVGFVFDVWNENALLTAKQLQPQYLIVDADVVPDDADLSTMAWRWMVYVADEAADALRWAARGVELVETNDIGALLQDPRLATWGCVRRAL